MSLEFYRDSKGNMDDYTDRLHAAGLEYANNAIAGGATESLEAPFSGEWADGLTYQNVLDAVGINARFEDLDEFEQTDVLDAWEAGYYSAEWEVN